jgi:hypothetical protein
MNRKTNGGEIFSEVLTMATGTYHKFNYLKFRILETLFDAYPASIPVKRLQTTGILS